MRIFSGLHKTVMRTVEALIPRSCACYDFHKIVVHIFEALTVGSNVHTAKQIKKHMPRVELMRWTRAFPVSRPTMNDSVLSLPNAQALPPPSRKLRDVSRVLHPHDEIADRLRL